MSLPPLSMCLIGATNTQMLKIISIIHFSDAQLLTIYSFLGQSINYIFILGPVINYLLCVNSPLIDLPFQYIHYFRAVEFARPS